jgi:DNA replication protein DnaC
MEQSNTDYAALIDEMRQHLMTVPSERVHIRIPNAAGILASALGYFIGLEGRKAVWRKEYDAVASWLSDNGGKGLLLSGNCGSGKSVLSRLVIPAVLLRHARLVANVYDASRMNGRIDEVLQKRIVSLDDVGTEAEAVEYGNRRMAFAEIVELAEKEGKLLIVSTNLRGEGLLKRYGERVTDRIFAIMRIIEFNGKSLRI